MVGLGKKSINNEKEEEIDEKRRNVRLAAGEGVKALRDLGATNIGVDKSLGDIQGINNN